jgi:uncharacterized membrane protein YcaP (DUF421 family)
LREERVTAEEIHAVVRGGGYASLEQTGAVILETDGSMHALEFSVEGSNAALERVRDYPQ